MVKKQKKSNVKRKARHTQHRVKTIVQQPIQSMQEQQIQSQQNLQDTQQLSQQNINLEELRVGMHPHHKRVYIIAAVVMLLFILLLLFNSISKSGKDISGKAIGDGCNNDLDCNVDANEFCDVTKQQEIFVGTCQAKPLEAGDEDECEDSDGDVVTEKGITKKGDATQTDYCKDETTVNEFICENNEITPKEIQCDEGYKCDADMCVEKPKETCIDNIKNQDETDVDCGGDSCPNKCVDGNTCKYDQDCQSNYCFSGICAEKSVPIPGAESQCIDSDGGIVFNTKGSVAITAETGVITKEDNCYGTPLSKGPNKGKQYLIEYYCEDNNHKQIEKLCICEAGACKVEESPPEPVKPKKDTILCEEYYTCISTSYETDGQTFYKDSVQKATCDDLGNQEQVIIKECENGCNKNFQCVEDDVIQPVIISCMDSDLTDNPFIAGEVNLAGEKSIDQCLEGTFVKYYCDNQANVKSAEPVTCEDGCDLTTKACKIASKDPASECTDSDKIDIAQQGTTTDSTGSYIDDCNEKGQLVEYYCDAVTKKATPTEIDCPVGIVCNQGTCILPVQACKDNDNTFSPNAQAENFVSNYDSFKTKSYITINDGQPVDDKCKSDGGPVLYEQFCLGANTYSTSNINCQTKYGEGYSCFDGACVLPENVPKTGDDTPLSTITFTVVDVENKAAITATEAEKLKLVSSTSENFDFCYKIDVVGDKQLESVEFIATEKENIQNSKSIFNLVCNQDQVICKQQIACMIKQNISTQGLPLGFIKKNYKVVLKYVDKKIQEKEFVPEIVVPVNSCANGVQDVGEDGVDCGNICPVCPETPPEPAQQICEDSDGGEFTDSLGSVKFIKQDGTINTETDSCTVDGNNVIEYSCGDVGQLVTNEITCQEGYACNGGICAKKEIGSQNKQDLCVDSDKDDETKKGTLTLQTGSTYSDFCITSENSGTKVQSSEYLYEYYCNLDGSSATKIQKCVEQTFCIDGECKKINGKCNDEDKTYVPYSQGFEESYNAGSIYKKSLITGINSENETEESESDYCSADGKLAEGVCSDKDYYNFEEINCPSGYKCSEGVCILDVSSDSSDDQPGQTLLCKDTDAANAENIKGEVYVTDAEGVSIKAGEDTCADSQIIETTCTEAGLFVSLELKDCSADTVCQSGACVALPESCSSVTDCPINYNCDKTTNKCVKIAGLCSSSSECAEGEECLQNSCVKMPESCTDASECPIGFTCNADKKCKKVSGYCDSLINCLGTQECKNNVCVEVSKYCIDSEGTIVSKNITNKGTVATETYNAPHFTDYCVEPEDESTVEGSGFVYEYYCKEDLSYGSEVIQCPEGSICSQGACVCDKPEKEGQYCGDKNTLYEKVLDKLTCIYESEIVKECTENELCTAPEGIGSCTPITIACVDNKLITTNTETTEEISLIDCPETCADNKCVCAEGTKYVAISNICDDGKPNQPASGKAYLDLDKEDKDGNNFVTVNITDPDGILSIQVLDAKGVEEHKENCDKKKDCLVPSAALVADGKAVVLSNKVCSLTSCTEDKITVKVTDAKGAIYTITLNQKNKFYFESKDWTVDESQFTTNYDSLKLQLCGCPKPVAPKTDGPGTPSNSGGGGSSGSSCSAQYNDPLCQTELEKQPCLVGIKTYQCPSTNSCKKDKKIEKVCSALFVPPLVNKCFNKQKDSDEQGVDCGGNDCKPCPPVAQVKVQGLAQAKSQKGEGFVGEGLDMSGEDKEGATSDKVATEKDMDKEKKPKKAFVWYLLLLAFVVAAMLVFVIIKRKQHNAVQDQLGTQQQVQQKPVQSQQAPLQKVAQPLVAPPKITVQQQPVAQPIIQSIQKPAQVQQQPQQVVQQSQQAQQMKPVEQQQVLQQQQVQQPMQQQPQMSAIEQAKFDKLKQYAQMELQKGFTKEQVKQKLISVGWKEEMVEHILQ